MVFYRKYRSQTISDLDLTTVRERLLAILKSGEIPHAFLFTGSRGLGKTSAARILAKAINCEKKSEGGKKQVDNGAIEPCNTCQACISITNGSNVDVLEIDAASNRGVDEIRGLRERVKFAPSSLSKKVYIIDEVHMLTNEAFNALLKTLEEPPSHVVFILCTTEVWKVLPTIISRTFHIAFEQPTKEEIIRSVMRAAKGEGLQIEDAVLEKIYVLAEGSFRDGMKVLEELALAAGESKKITLETVESLYKAESIDTQVKELIIALASKDGKKGLEIIQELSGMGVDFKIVNERVVESLRELLMAKAGLEKKASDLSFSASSLEQLLTLFNQAYKDIKFSVIPQLPLELAIIKWSFGEEEVSIKQEVKQEVPEQKTQATISASPKKQQVTVSVGNAELFGKLIDSVKQENHSIAGILRGCSLVEVGDSALTVSTAYKFHGDKLSEEKARKVIEKCASAIIGKSVTLQVKVGS